VSIATHFQSGAFASNIVVTDRSWWSEAIHVLLGGDLGAKWATVEAPAIKSSLANKIGATCGGTLIRDSIAVSIRQSGYGGEKGTLYVLNRMGQPLIYYSKIASD
jgi:hypothetical protein